MRSVSDENTKCAGGRRPPPQAAAMGSVSDGNSMHAGERRGKGSAPKGEKRNPALGLSPPYFLNEKKKSRSKFQILRFLEYLYEV